MNINIGGKYIIESNAHDFILYEVRIVQQGKTAGQETKARIGYFAKLEQLIKALFSHEIKSEEIQSLQDMQRHIEKMALQLEKAFSEISK